MADKEEVEPAAEPSSAELSGASQTSADLKASRTEVNGAAVNGSETAKEDGERTTLSRRRSWSPPVSLLRPRAPVPRQARRRHEGYEGEEPEGRSHQQARPAG